MIDINSHPIWRGINPFKKRGHLLRIFLARQYGKLLPSSKFIGVTGSVGKTTTVIASQAVLMQKYKTISTAQTHAEMPNLDTIFNLPMTILRVRPGIEKIVLEMGIEYKGEMDFYLHLIQPQTAIVTRIANAHSEFLGDVEEIASEKGKLVASLPAAGVAILNFDDPLVKKMAETTKAKVLYFGTNSKECHVWASDIKITNFQLSFGLNYGVESVEIKSHFLGLHQVYPLLAAATLGLEASIPLMKIKKALESIAPPEHRLQPLDGDNNSIVLDYLFILKNKQLKGSVRESVSADTPIHNLLLSGKDSAVPVGGGILLIGIITVLSSLTAFLLNL